MTDASQPVELWAGLECTLNRVGDVYFDQCEFSGHNRRADDLELFADLGVKALRYPVLWERQAPHAPGQFDWAWADSRLNRLRELGQRVIATLVHHGSGPRYTNLLDPAFPVLLADYARAVAERYPWVEDYTPVNEPLTTARFSTLYGLWYPHAKSRFDLLRALVNECRGAVLSMKAIWEINPKARFINTEDLGQITSTPLLQYQADYENQRRWLGMDLLCGKVDEHHPWWQGFRAAGFTPAEIHWFKENAVRPDILGINHYVTSNRHLDENLDHYPQAYHGGNWKHRYADVEAVRVRGQNYESVKNLLLAAWERYHLPLAITEAHIDAGREDQMRWLREIWDSCNELKAKGVDVRALTVWSLLGSFDWNNLVTAPRGYYESGVFDLRAGFPRPTALAKMVKKLATEGAYSHPLFDADGWWHQPAHKLYPPPAKEARSEIVYRRKGRGFDARPILITGARGTLGRAFARVCEVRGLNYSALKRNQMDISNPVSIEHALRELDPWAVINAAGFVRVDEAETERERCLKENAEGAARLAHACANRGLKLLTFSSDLVFDGQADRPYVETSPVAPLNIYGHSKARAEQEVLAIHPEALVIRTSAFFGPWDNFNFVTLALRDLAQGRSISAAEDVVVSPTYIPDLVFWCLNLLIDEEKGVWHLNNQGQITWADFARAAAELAGLIPGRVNAVKLQELGLRAPRPLFSAMTSERGLMLPPLEAALASYKKDTDDFEFLKT